MEIMKKIKDLLPIYKKTVKLFIVCRGMNFTKMLKTCNNFSLWELIVDVCLLGCKWVGYVGLYVGTMGWDRMTKKWPIYPSVFFSGRGCQPYVCDLTLFTKLGQTNARQLPSTIDRIGQLQEDHRRSWLVIYSGDGPRMERGRSSDELGFNSTQHPVDAEGHHGSSGGEGDERWMMSVHSWKSRWRRCVTRRVIECLSTSIRS